MMSIKQDFAANATKVDEAIEFLRLAVADGWESNDYVEGKPVSCHLVKKNRCMHVYFHFFDKDKKKPAAPEIYIWGSDDLAIQPPAKYSMQAIIDGEKHCNICNKDNVNTGRYSFAGRCCMDCSESAKVTHEFPGWNN